MKFYRIIPDASLSHEEKEGNAVSVNLNNPVVDLQGVDTSFSDGIVPIIDGSVLDTNDPIIIAKYKNNLQVLKKRVLRDGFISQFRLIREDNFFPYDWMWRVNSNHTTYEYAKSKLSYSLRMAEVRSRISPSSSFGFAIPGDTEAETKEMSKLDSFFGQVYEPTKFRSTKHFTINTGKSTCINNIWIYN